MAVKRLIRAIVPPLFYHAAHEIKKLVNAPEAPAEGAPPDVRLSYSPKSSFAEAALECGKGYEKAEVLVKAHTGPHAWLDRMQDYQAPFLASFSIAALKAADIVKVLDFGGGTAVSKAVVNDFFEDRYRTDWTVVEVPEQVLHNSDLVQDDLRYTTEIGSAAYDIAIFAGSLQYVEHWQAPLTDVNAELILISRTPMGNIRQAYVQSVEKSGHSYKFPGQIIPRPEVIELLSKRYRLFAHWDFTAHLVEMGLRDSPAMLWKRVS
jgi:putative methyltransferase (TIGR04325 family)